MADPVWSALALASADRLGHLRFEHLLHDCPDNLTQSIRVLKQEVFDGSDRGLRFNLGHGGVPCRESVTSTSPACHDRPRFSALQNLQHTTAPIVGATNATFEAARLPPPSRLRETLASSP